MRAIECGAVRFVPEPEPVPVPEDHSGTRARARARARARVSRYESVVDGYTLLLAAAAGSTAALLALRALGGDDDRRLVRRAARTPRLGAAAVDEARPGTLARVVGVVRPVGALLPSDLDATPALALDATLAVAVGDSRTPLGRHARAAAAILLETDDGALLVRAAAPRLLLATVVERVRPLEHLPPAQRATADAALSRARHRAAAIAWREARLLPGARVAVVGRVARLPADPADGHAYRDRAPRAALVGAPAAPLLITDDPAALA